MRRPSALVLAFASSALALTAALVGGQEAAKPADAPALAVRTRRLLDLFRVGGQVHVSHHGPISGSTPFGEGITVRLVDDDEYAAAVAGEPNVRALLAQNEAEMQPLRPEMEERARRAIPGRPVRPGQPATVEDPEIQKKWDYLVQEKQALEARLPETVGGATVVEIGTDFLAVDTRGFVTYYPADRIRQVVRYPKAAPR